MQASEIRGSGYGALVSDHVKVAGPTGTSISLEALVSRTNPGSGVEMESLGDVFQDVRAQRLS
jgi:hypothetical protein